MGQLSELKEGRVYQVKDGKNAGFLFLYSFGHKRPFLSVADYEALGFTDFEIIPCDVADAIPEGPPAPRRNIDSLIEIAIKTGDIDLIRSVFCRSFCGTGYEIGAGTRPTSVPADAHVTYIDKFTFEEAKDGSFISIDPKNLVKVSIFEEMEQLPSIPDDSADFFIACHVIEHIPNVLKGLEEVSRKLKANGCLFLAIPSKPYIFDAHRPTTTLEHFIADYFSPSSSLEHYLEYARLVDRANNWIMKGRADFERRRDLHYHTFEPRSMRELLSYAKDIGMFSHFEVCDTPAKFSEFYAMITK